MLTDDHVDKIRDYLFAHNQQELAGHLDNLWQEVQEYRPRPSDDTKLIEGQTPDEQRIAREMSGWGSPKDKN